MCSGPRKYEHMILTDWPQCNVDLFFLCVTDSMDHLLTHDFGMILKGNSHCNGWRPPLSSYMRLLIYLVFKCFCLTGTILLYQCDKTPLIFWSDPRINFVFVIHKNLFVFVCVIQFVRGNSAQKWLVTQFLVSEKRSDWLTPW